MKTNLTELVFILDRSGSMSGLEKDTIGGFNSMLQKQQQEPGAARVTTVLFDNAYELVHDRLDLQAVSPLDEETYYVRGSTALLDAMGRSIQKVDAVMTSTTPAHRPDKVLVVVITDGFENASHRFTGAQIASLVKDRRQMGWEFVFMGANMDAIAVARDYGFAEDRATTFVNDAEGVAMNFQAVDHLTRQVRSGQAIDSDWDRAIRERGDGKKKR